MNHRIKIVAFILTLSSVFLLCGQGLFARGAAINGINWNTSAPSWRDDNGKIVKASSSPRSQGNLAKSILDYKQRMDSLVQQSWSGSSSQWEKILMEAYTYNAAGNLVLFTKGSRTTTNQWNVFWKEEYTYNAAGKMSQLILMVLDSATSQLVNYWKEEYTHNASGNITLYRVYTWSPSTSAWVNSWKAEYTYDANGHLSIYQDYYWGGSAWVNSWKAEYTYTASGYLALYQDYYYNTGSGQWISSWKAEYTYNTANLIVLYQEYAWNTSTNLWINSGKKDYLYNPAGLLSAVSEYVWNSNQWRYAQKEEYTYNTLGSEILHQLFLPNQAGNQWVNAWKAETTYDVNGYLDLIIESDWMLSPGQWVNGSMWDYNYNPAFHYQEILMPFWYESNKLLHNAMLEHYTEYVYANNAWLAVSKDEFYYTYIGSTGIEHEGVKIFNVFPNPAKDLITIQSNGHEAALEFLLYDLSGRLIYSFLTHPGDPLSISHIKNGMYIYTIRNKETNVTGKLIIE